MQITSVLEKMDDKLRSRCWIPLSMMRAMASLERREN